MVSMLNIDSKGYIWPVENEFINSKNITEDIEISHFLGGNEIDILPFYFSSRHYLQDRTSSKILQLMSCTNQILTKII